MSRSRVRPDSAGHRIVGARRTVGALVLALVAFVLVPQALAQDDIGLPIHPQAVASTIVRRSGEGEGTRWFQVSFTANAPYGQVVKFYREKVGRDAQVSQVDSGKLMNTLILISRDPADQFNVNISSKPGKKATRVELSRNVAGP
ncbi:MAG: hypothetical protein C3F12_05340 [Candidatus Methylomirabilota bacterium]|nr:hypothetical protein [candidate division NC10 bacterium]PWB47394.1 MAG: hypothetical protein C3F12_05340 [candidate division NC10 bacterium]